MSLLPSKRLGGLVAPPADHMPRGGLVGALPQRSATRGHVRTAEGKTRINATCRVVGPGAGSCTPQNAAAAAHEPLPVAGTPSRKAPFQDLSFMPRPPKRYLTLTSFIYSLSRTPGSGLPACVSPPDTTLIHTTPHPAVATSALRLRRGTAGTGSSSSGSSKGGSGSSTSTSTSNLGSRAAQLFELEKEGGYVSAAPAPTPTPAAGSGGGDSANGDFLDDGWGVVAVAPAGGSAATAAAAKAVAKKDKKKDKKAAAGPAGAAVSGVAAAAAQTAAAKRQARADSRGTPFVDKNSDAGITGLTLLQARLLEAGACVCLEVVSGE